MITLAVPKILLQQHTWLVGSLVIGMSMRVQIHRFPISNRCNKILVSIHQVNKQTLYHQSITQMVIR